MHNRINRSLATHQFTFTVDYEKTEKEIMELKIESKSAVK